MSSAIRLLQLTDPHLFADPAERIRGFPSALGLHRVVERVAASRPDLVLLTGDLSQDESEASYRRLSELCKPIAAPIYAIPGNHDRRAAMRVLDEGAIRRAFRVDHGGWTLLLLDSLEEGSVGGTLGAEQLRRLDTELRAAAPRPTLIVLHHPPLSIGSPDMDAVGLSDAAALWARLDPHPHVAGVLFGHIHREFSARRGGVALWGSPSTCVQFCDGEGGSQLDQRLPGYRLLELQASGEIGSTLYRVHPYLDRIISGGQSGVDRAALDVAEALGIASGGWCPYGRRSETGPIPPHYPLRETPSADYRQRTEWNLRDSDATLIIATPPLRGGTALTLELAQAMGRPFMLIDPGCEPELSAFENWLKQNRVRTLNIAGPREANGIYAPTLELLRRLLTGVGRESSRPPPPVMHRQNGRE